MERVAIVSGIRTPFAKAGTALREYSFLDLSIKNLNALIEKANIKEDQVDEVIFGTVLLDPRIPNAARELVIQSKLSNNTSAHFISNNCISGMVSLNFAADGIKTGRVSSVIAGGVESMSNPTLTFKKKAEKFFLKLSRTRKTSDKLKLLKDFRLSFGFPVPPSPKEPSTGLNMGQHCELTTQELEIARDAQDKLSYDSHQNAAKALENGYFKDEIFSIGNLDKDNIIRAKTTLEKLSSLRTAFEKSDKASLTAGNSTALTDGSSAVYLMSETRAKKEKREILGFVDAVEFAAIDPNLGLLMAPCVAVPKLLEKNKLKVSDIDLFEIHEAFAAQVLANLKVWENGWDKLPELKPIGKIPFEKINPNGGSLAIGHPFAATGGRLVISAVNELKRSGKKRAVLSACAASGMAGAVLISRD